MIAFVVPADQDAFHDCRRFGGKPTTAFEFLRVVVVDDVVTLTAQQTTGKSNDARGQVLTGLFVAGGRRTALYALGQYTEAGRVRFTVADSRGRHTNSS
ncbi:MAG TPA: hypothetical protein VFA26_02290 [Gemmataceae bacterium]|nr:hypothetical protein [Gemmataceae bacterium]